MSSPNTALRLRRRKRLFGALWVLLLLTFLEIISYAAGRVLQGKWAMYRAPAPLPNGRALGLGEYLTRRDSVLGWPYPDEFGGAGYDQHGARRSPASERIVERAACVSLFGDSFTKGSEVDDEHAWGNLLAEMLGCRVMNYGVGGYGTDQAYLRCKQLPDDCSRVVVLGHVSENIIRNLTRNRDLVNYARWLALKPRFVLNQQGQLTLVPIPRLTDSEYRRWVGVESPRLVIEHESFHIGGPAGATDLRFPYTYAILRNFGDFRLRAKLARRPVYAEFYEPGHTLDGLKITSQIIVSFVRDARRAGKTPLVILFATQEDLLYYRRTSRWTYQTLADALRRSGVDFLDFGPQLLKHIGQRGTNGFFKPRTHYNEEVNRLIAESVVEHLSESGVLHPHHDSP